MNKINIQHLQAILLLIIFNLQYYFATAQWYDPEKVNSKASEMYNKAYEAAQQENYTDAMKYVASAIKFDAKFVDAYLTRAGIYANMKKYDSSVIDFEKGITLDSIYAATYYLPYSISLAGVGQFEKALITVNQFLQNKTLNERSLKAGRYRQSVYQFAVEYEKMHPSKDYIFAPENLGDSINTIYGEYYPSITIDGKNLIFTRRINSDEDFYESTLENGIWQKALPLSGMVNTNLNEGAQNISQDGEWIIFAGCNYPEGQGSCDLYISYKTLKGWSEPGNLGPVINTDFWESSPSLSPDKRDLYFSSDKPGGYGGRDIWVSHRNGSKWSRPENLGPEINTSGNESSAFMYADNQTLFFNSNGHPGYGQTDIFFSKKQADSTWDVPINLGYPVNTINDEGSLIVAPDGKTAYYASDPSDSKGALDLYSFQLRKDIRPPKTLWVRGKVYDSKTLIGLPSSVELTNTKNQVLLSKVQTDEQGNYLTTLPIGNNYAFNVNRQGYLFYSENYELTDSNLDSVFHVDIPLQPIEKGAVIILKNIFFDTRMTELKPASITELNKVLQLMLDNPTLKILITGHTDNVGKAQDNFTLSNGRALAVINYLLASKKIEKNRLQFKGLGATKPIENNDTEQGRSINRRTELSVIGIDNLK